MAASTNKVGKAYRRYFPLILALWLLLVLYPNPFTLALSIHRASVFQVDPGAVDFILADLPSDPEAIEKVVLTMIPYRYDWEVYKVPWYFPTVKEVLERGQGDCKARALILASIFKARGIPYRVNLSPIHIWIDYQGKEETPIENARVMFLQQDPETGRRIFQIPRIGIDEVLESFRQAFWSPMPQERRLLLLLGLAALIAIRATWLRSRYKGEEQAILFESTLDYNRGRCR